MRQYDAANKRMVDKKVKSTPDHQKRSLKSDHALTHHRHESILKVGVKFGVAAGVGINRAGQLVRQSWLSF